MANLRSREAQTVGVPADHAAMCPGLVVPPFVCGPRGALGSCPGLDVPSRSARRCWGPSLTTRADTSLPQPMEILAGQWQLLGVVRRDMENPDWFFDPVTGTRAPQADYCFKVDHRSEDVTGNVKQIWELSRMHHVTVLAAAFSVSGDERYALAPPRISVPGGLRTRSSPACTGRVESRPDCG